MTPRYRRAPLVRIAVVLMLLATGSASVHAHVVRTLADMVDEEARARLGSIQKARGARAAPTLQLLAIWGIEHDLSARISVQGRALDLKVGTREAKSTGVGQIRLLKIQPPCVQLQVARAAKRLCMPVTPIAGVSS